MAEIVLKDVCKVFEKDQYAVSNFSLHIRDGEFIVFVGPSGCGKSTTLRMIAGLEEITSGELWIGDRLCNYAEPGERDLSMVFQNYALYPQMSVYDNMAFALSVRKVPKKEIRQRVEATAGMLGISHLLTRRPAALSGGQKQRVAIGTTIYVTHDQTEAMTLADRIVVMKAGYIQQVATPVELYNRPTNMFVAGFIGSPSMNFLKGKVGRAGDGAAFLTEAGQIFPLTAAQAKVLWPQYDNRALVLGIRPEDLYTVPEHAGRLYGRMEGIVTACEGLGSEAILHLQTGDGEFAARVQPDHGASEDRAATLYLDMENAHFFDGETEQNIFYQWRNEA